MMNSCTFKIFKFYQNKYSKYIYTKLINRSIIYNVDYYILTKIKILIDIILLNLFTNY